MSTNQDTNQTPTTICYCKIYFQVYISHIDTPNDFYVQLSSDALNIENVQAKLQTEVDDMQILENPAAGILCAAPYSLDSVWYRAEILDADDDITTVRFIDFGNTDVIDNSKTQVYLVVKILFLFFLLILMF